ncbi:hypothetical protein CGI23_24210 [Vibrio parahaemolyticus]|uniref:hypothetical protein n=1 Tax=Vibrio parahaemolyticus TaxID=670 RepID=UPI001123AAB5|nr:hypothetical protein [Vibrio parahaemolyticus]TOK18360.1 hypothetical protein CGI23_24210 [Vibrio parahaemolyticus]
MKFNPICLLLSLGCMLASHANAIEINSLFSVADAQGNATFNIKNTQDKRLFLNVGMSKLEVVNGEIVTTPYSRDNIKDWEIDVRPARTIVDIGQTKDFQVTMRCGAHCDNKTDQFYQIAFVPSPYFDGETKPEKSVQMAIGFGATLVNPAPDQPISYQATYKGKQVTVVNTGKTYLKARIDNCSDDASDLSTCTRAFNVLPSRTLTVNVPDSMQKDYVDLTLKTNLDKYSEQKRLLK